MLVCTTGTNACPTKLALLLWSAVTLELNIDEKGEVGSRLSSLAGAVLRERQGRFDKSQAELVGDSARLD